VLLKSHAVALVLDWPYECIDLVLLDP
jgi:hypothetical protein